MEEPDVICVRHECLKDVCCFSVPPACPVCGRPLAGRFLREAPLSIPDPLLDGHKMACCLLVAPTDRHADGGFDGTSELHAGIANTSGVMYNYTGAGMRRDRSGWRACVSVPLVRPDAFRLLAQWDQHLERFSCAPPWDPTRHRYAHAPMKRLGAPLSGKVHGQRPWSLFLRRHTIA
ncbi:MKRN2 opposite strand protein isoform X2 [Syngnathus acus]|uniref:MKRN2 opposite strand protein isoform X2 n=1 Tax=Syngnathus acus TaxID=161584 RepID=UPI0018862FF1|nr:MKRN2 opposite strand protein isoform X2 [Syngnathus acus]